ncbi:MAG: hypothetical protein HYZ42_12125 [Bacteroidetes bacterium]|nr:hypothetical protein [Bacteroidota bacterium]
MKSVLSIFLLLVFSFQLMTKTAVLVYWKVNQARIINEYCVNKNKPELECGGCCHLKKQLDKIEDENSQDVSKPQELPKPKVGEVESFVSHSSRFDIFYCFEHGCTFELKHEYNLYSCDYNETCFNPPEILMSI